MKFEFQELLSEMINHIVTRIQKSLLMFGLMTLILALNNHCSQRTSTDELLDAKFTSGPIITQVSPLQYDRISITFSQIMDTSSTTDTTHYTINQSNGGVLAVQSVISAQDTVAIIRTAPQTSLAEYSLRIDKAKSKINLPLAYPGNQRNFLGFNSTGGTLTDMMDGTIYASGLNLFFQKCSVGQTWNQAPNDCTGAGNAGNNYLATTGSFCSTGNDNCNNGISSNILISPFLGGSSSAIYSSCDSLNTNPVGGFAGHQKWRVAKIEELLAIVKLNSNPSVNQTIFPNSVAGIYWSSTAFGLNSAQAYVINFSTGISATQSKINVFYARCVSDN